MIYKLVCAGDNHFNQLYEKDDNEIIVAIDGGYKALKEKNIKIDYFFGDYDDDYLSDYYSNWRILRCAYVYIKRK